MENFPTRILVVAIALTDDSGRVLMHRRPDEKEHGGLWEFPGGKVEDGETLEKATVREVSEELGILVQEADLRPVAFAERQGQGTRPSLVILLYTCSVWQGGEPVCQEGGGVGWFTMKEAQALAMPPLDVELLKQISVSR